MKALTLYLASLVASIRARLRPSPPTTDAFRATWRPIVDLGPPPIGRAVAHCMKCGQRGTVVLPTDHDDADAFDDQIDSRQCQRCQRYAMVAD
jgi:hypothetical protein